MYVRCSRHHLGRIEIENYQITDLLFPEESVEYEFFNLAFTQFSKWYLQLLPGLACCTDTDGAIHVRDPVSVHHDIRNRHVFPTDIFDLVRSVHWLLLCVPDPDRGRPPAGGAARAGGGTVLHGATWSHRVPYAVPVCVRVLRARPCACAARHGAPAAAPAAAAGARQGLPARRHTQRLARRMAVQSETNRRGSRQSHMEIPQRSAKTFELRV